MSNLENWFTDLQRVIDAPYPEGTDELSGWMHSEELETHLLATPRRKTVLFMDRTGDYEYDEAMTVDVEVGIAVEIDQCYSALCQRMTDVYGTAVDLDLEDPSIQARIEPEDYNDDETMSFLTGAYYDGSDDGDATFWELKGNYVCIQKIKNWGDGDFQFYVIATVTPREDS